MYEAASDPIKRFALDYLEAGNGSAKVVKDDVYTVYTEMCDREGERPADKGVFKDVIGSIASLDTESTQTRALTPGDNRVYAWKYVEFADSAEDLMPSRLVERYYDETETPETATETVSDEAVAFNATPLTEAAQSLTGYVTVTAEVFDVETYGDGENATTNAILKDQSGAMDMVTWNDSVAVRLEELEGETVVIENAEVGEHDGTRQLQPKDGLTEIRTVQKGVGYTEGPNPTDESQGQLSETVANGGDEIEGTRGTVKQYIAKKCEKGDTVTVPAVASQNDDLSPDGAKSALKHLAETTRLIETASDGWEVL